MEKFRKTEQLSYWRFFLLVFLGGFVLGILFVNMVWNCRTQDIDTLSLFSAGEGGSLQIRTRGYLWYLVQKRTGILWLYHFAGITRLGTAAVIAGLLWLGFLSGTLASIAILQLGLKGFAVITASCVPQVFIYIPAGLYYLTAVYQMSEKSLGMDGVIKKLYKGYLLRCLAALAAVFCGILLECYVNPYILNVILKMS